MSVKHLCTSYGKRCGIAQFSTKIDGSEESFEAVNTLENIEDGPLLVEHEYGLHKDIPWDTIANWKGKKTVIQHAYSDHHKYMTMNKLIMNTFDQVIFLTKECKRRAASDYPHQMNKMNVMKHYSEPLRHEPTVKVNSPFTIGIHGFAFPRNGFTRFIHMMYSRYYWDKEVRYPNSGLPKIYIMSTLNDFDKIAERETSTYIDKLRRIIWDYKLEDFVELDFTYYETKDEIIDKLREKCDGLVHLTHPAKDYYNASGSINTLMATGLPLFALESVYTENLPEGSYLPFDIDKGFEVDGWNPDIVNKYHEDTSVENFSKKLLEICS
jgi:hypothetical protein